MWLFAMYCRCPDNVNAHEKKKFISHKAVLRKRLVGIGKELYISHIDDLGYDETKESCGVLWQAHYRNRQHNQINPMPIIMMRDFF